MWAVSIENFFLMSAVLVYPTQLIYYANMMLDVSVCDKHDKY